MNATTQLVRHEPRSGKVLSIYLRNMRKASRLGGHCETFNFLYVAQAVCHRCQSAVRPIEDLLDGIGAFVKG